MSGSAGKVYFVLYLAVVLELLIIIVERDEAEEHLHAKQKETMKIVKSILSQLQAGSGSEGITTKPKDEISVPGKNLSDAEIEDVLGTALKTDRKYIIKVGVTDVGTSLERLEGEEPKAYQERLETLAKQANVESMEYQIFFNPNKEPGDAPVFPNDTLFDEFLRSKGVKDANELEIGTKVTIDGEDTGWQLKGVHNLEMNLEKVYENLEESVANDDVTVEDLTPIYNLKTLGGIFPSKGLEEDQAFLFSGDVEEEDLKDAESVNDVSEDEADSREFIVSFQPPAEAGWFKLRFDAKKNTILGIKGGVAEIDDDEFVNIGTVQLKIKELKKVKKELDKSDDISVASSIVKDAGSAFTFKEGQNYKSFQAAINRALSNAEMKYENNKEKMEEVLSEIQLYGYIVTLLTPGMSKNFDQNQNSIDFDVRVLVLDPPPRNPAINYVQGSSAFDEMYPAVRTEIAPWEKANELRGEVYQLDGSNITGSPVANIIFEPQTNNEPSRGGKRIYLGKADKKLTAGNGVPKKYGMKISHTLKAKTTDTIVELTVFPSKIESDNGALTARFDAFSYYGGRMNFAFTPPSGQKLPPERFGYYFSTDASGSGQGPSIRTGLKAEFSDELYFDVPDTEATLRIVYKDPIYGQEVEHYNQTVSIKQDQPTINVNNAAPSVTPGRKDIEVSITGITIVTPNYGVNKSIDPSSISLSVLNPRVNIDGGWAIDGQPEITIDGANASIYFTISGGKPDKRGNVVGNVDLMISAVATNPETGAQSESTNQPYNVTIETKLERGGNQGGGANIPDFSK